MSSPRARDGCSANLLELADLGPSDLKRIARPTRVWVALGPSSVASRFEALRRGYIVHGKIAFEGRSVDDLNNNELIRKFYLGL